MKSVCGSWSSFPSRALPLVILLLAVFAEAPGAHAAAERILVAADFEQPTVLRASDVLPPEVLKSEHHEVDEEVYNDGFLNHFRIASEFGLLEVQGEPMLAIRVQELGALAELARVSRISVFANSALAAITSPVNVVAELAARPGETAAGIGQGVGRMWRGARSTATGVNAGVRQATARREGRDEESGAARSTQQRATEAARSYAGRYFGSTAAERRWAQKLGVDPYTSNETLRRAIREVARVDAAGSFAVRFVGMPSIPGANIIADVNQLVWNKSPRELNELNTGKLAAMGADKALIERFFANPFFLSPTRQTRFVAALGDLDGVADRAVAVELAAAAESEPEAQYHIGSAMMLGWLQGGGARLARLAPSRVIPMALAQDGRLAVAVPTDYTLWTEDLAAGVERLEEIGRDAGADRREAWFRREVSDRCRRELENRGWKVHTGFTRGLGS